jgi:hypothetical protein
MHEQIYGSRVPHAHDLFKMNMTLMNTYEIVLEFFSSQSIKKKNINLH